MAERPYFYVNENGVYRRDTEFEWYAGFSAAQKQKSIHSLHGEIERHGRKPLEVSTKSESLLGKKLSAFNLELDGYPLENIFQSSKVFEKGGPFPDILEMKPKDAKHDERLQTSGKLIKFQYHDTDWPLIPKTLFYDFLYYNAVRACISEEELKELSGYDAFTDIEFNPNKSLNTQARSVAMVTYVFQKNGCLPEMDEEQFLQLHKDIVKK